MVSHSKIILAGLISGMVALTTGILGVTGTVIGSVIASVIYNFLSESLESQIEKADITKFENELIYLFPLIVITIIHFSFILAFLADLNFIGYSYLNVYLTLQDLVSNNLYRILGISTLFISIYPRFLKTEKLNASESILLAFVGVIFLLKGFIDFNNPIVYLYRDFYSNVTFQLAIIAFIILIYLILKLGYAAYHSNLKQDIKHKNMSKKDLDDLKLKKINFKDVNKGSFKNNSKLKNHDSKNYVYKKNNKFDSHFKKLNSENKEDLKINTSSENIKFVSNNMFNDKKKK